MMDVDEILAELEAFTGKLPRAALEAAAERREEITPHLIRIVEETAQDPERLIEDEDYASPLLALYLLGQFRETRAYPAIVLLAAMPADVLMEALEDVVTGDLSRILASVYDGDADPIKALIEDPAVGEYVRGAAIDALVILVVHGKLARDEVMAYFRELLQEKLEREHSQVWNALVAAATDLYPEEIIGEIESAFENDLVDPFYIRLQDVKDRLARNREAVLEKTRQDHFHQFMGSAVAELQTWAAFTEAPPKAPVAMQVPPKPPVVTRASAGPPPISASGSLAPQPVVKPRKIGRNEPCPCGSGKKYKRCCGR